MTAYLIFSNPGEIDPRLITTLGVNVKEGSGNPIGYFGTGLKYAIAVTLRLGGHITVKSGLRRYDFRTSTGVIRGKEFGFIEIGETSPNEPVPFWWQIGFTTELGKAWEPWMAVRELWANAQDEGGTVAEAGRTPEASLGQTSITVWGAEAILQAWRSRGEWLIQSEPLVSHPSCDIHPGPSRAVFYRGIRVTELPRPSLYTYNVQEAVPLTEDRTAPLFVMYRPISKAILEAGTAEMIRAIATAEAGRLEGNSLDFNWHGIEPSKVAIEAVREAYRTARAKVNRSLAEKVRGHLRDLDTPAPVALSRLEAKVLDRARAFLAFLGIEITAEVLVVEDLGHWTAGRVADGKIYIARGAFGKGTKFVAGTLYEEELHLRHGFRDESREFQDFLVDKVMSMGEELRGEPL